MSKDIRDFLPCYLGCECISPGGLRVKFVGIIYRDGESWPQLQEFKNGRHHGPAFTVSRDQIKPILRRLESITDAELKERAFRNRDHYQEWLNHNDRKWPIDDLLWFLKNGFDMFELIREGLAIDQSTLKQDTV